MTRETSNVVSLRLARADGGELPAFTPGSHIKLRLGPDLLRQYSLCNGPDEMCAYVIAVKREEASRGGSATVHRLSVGDTISVSPPVDAFPLDWSAGHLLLLAGGIGLTPLLSMARHAVARGHAFSLHYFARSEEEAAFAGVLADADFSGRVQFHFGLSGKDAQSRLAEILDGAPDDAHAYICGPRAFMDAARRLAEGRLGAAAVHWESFGGGSAVASAATDGSFQIQIGRGGPVVTVPSNRTILQALQAEGFDVECSCLEGVCGMCATNVLEGVPDHRDEFLTDEAKESNEMMMVCVSRAQPDHRTRSLIVSTFDRTAPEAPTSEV